MIQGTASNVGKSVVVAALCRIFARMGLKVAPFKAQNMALNSFVTKEGLEIGRAQAVQAEAAGIEPTAEMNPVLLKPTTDCGSQVIWMGKPIGNRTAKEYYAMKEETEQVIRKAYAALCGKYDLIVIEGAGSPAEINLMENDLVNMWMADLADAPVILVSDIDRGGVFASLAGTLMLLPERHRERIRGFLINKFRGDLSLLQPGLDRIEGMLGRPVMGVLPYFTDIRIEEEDSVALVRKKTRAGKTRAVRIGVVRLPRISNYTDFDPLENHPGVELVYPGEADEIDGLDVLILPGSKDTLGDLRFLKGSGLAGAIQAFARSGGHVVGICGGFQMLGESVEDPDGLENGNGSEPGLGLLPVRTVLVREKVTARVRADSFDGLSNLEGYEIHMGRSRVPEGCRSMFRITRRNGEPVCEEDGARNREGNVWGTYLHGIFENTVFIHRFLGWVRGADGAFACGEQREYLSWKKREYNRLADLFQSHVDTDAFLSIVGR